MSQSMRVYLDHSASTPVDPRVLEAMMPYFSEMYGNPSASHSWGRGAENAIEAAREHIAQVLGCQPNEIIFTSGGTEGDNLALRGVGWAVLKRSGKARLLTTHLEHHAVNVTAKQLVQIGVGFETVFLPVDLFGRVDAAQMAAACDDDTLVSLMYANNEIGSVHPLTALTKLAHERGALFHTDAVQAAGQLPLNVAELGVDLLSVSAHKFYGPKGVGFLYARRGVTLIPSQSGGSHEEGRRAGTVNTPLIVGMAKALELAYQEQAALTAHYQARRDQLIAGVLGRITDAQLTGHPQERLPAHASFMIPDAESNAVLTHLDMRGVAASSGSSCKTGNPEPSEVLLAMGYTSAQALCGLRFSVGRQTTEADIDYAVGALVEAVVGVRKLRQLFR